MTPSEKIQYLVLFAQDLMTGLEKASAMVERAGEMATMAGNAEQQLGHLQVTVRPEFLINNWIEKKIELAALLQTYDRRRLTKNRLARGYQQRKRLKDGGNT